MRSHEKVFKLPFSRSKTHVGIPLNELVLPDQHPPANIYKYHIPTGEITQLTDHPGMDGTLDWISDDVLSVTPQGKKSDVGEN